MKKASSSAYNLSLLAILVAVFSLLGSFVLDGGDPNTMVMLLFFIILPLSIIVGIISSIIAIISGRKDAYIPLFILITYTLYIIQKLS